MQGEILKLPKWTRDILKSSVVRVGLESSVESPGHGTGFYIAKGKVATARHVIDALIGYSGKDESAFAVESFSHPKFLAFLLGKETEKDIAILSIRGSQNAAVIPIPIGDPYALACFDPVFTIGYAGREAVIRQGQFLGWSIDIPQIYPVPYIYTNAEVKFGNSGGPALNENGEVVGIIVMATPVINSLPCKLMATLVPINLAVEFLASLDEHPKPDSVSEEG